MKEDFSMGADNATRPRSSSSSSAARESGRTVYRQLSHSLPGEMEALVSPGKGSAVKFSQKKKKNPIPAILMIVAIGALLTAGLWKLSFLGEYKNSPGKIEYGALGGNTGGSSGADTTDQGIGKGEVMEEEEQEPPIKQSEAVLPPDTASGVSLYEKGGVTYIKIEGYEMLLVNKTYALPKDYGSGVDPVAQDALDQMFAAAAKDGISLWVVSGFRSYATQESIHNNYIAKYGVEYTKKISAEAGHSEHQTGLAFDLGGADSSTVLSSTFGDTAEFRWLSEHAHEYGFILRFLKDKANETGYIYEPWQYRYV